MSALACVLLRSGDELARPRLREWVRAQVGLHGGGRRRGPARATLEVGVVMDVTEVASAIAVTSVSILLVCTAKLGVDAVIAAYQLIRPMFR